MVRVFYFSNSSTEHSYMSLVFLLKKKCFRFNNNISDNILENNKREMYFT